MQVIVNWRQSVALVGTVLKYLAVPLVIPLTVAVIYGDDIAVFAVSIVATVAIGLTLERLEDGSDLRLKEAFLFVTLAWVGVSIGGAIPYLLAGYGTPSTVGLSLESPSAVVVSFVNALFESTSGFTTTGSTLLGEISFERHSHALLMYRQLTQWLGGMGIVVLMVGILSELAVSGAELIDAEAPGPELNKLTPKIAETARILWSIYAGITLLYIGLLYALHLAGLAPEMNLYSAIAHGFTTLPTGGFSPQAASIAAFSPAVQWLVIPFIVVAGTNFALFYFLLQGEYIEVFRNREFQAYVGVIAGIAVLLWGLLFTGTAPALEYGGVTAGIVENSLRQALFQTVTILNSTGYATSDFAQWQSWGQLLLLAVAFIGGSAGSTGGGIKIIRWLVLFKAARRQLTATVYPDAVEPVRLGDTVVDEDVVRAVSSFVFFYLFIFAVSAVVIALDAHRIGIELTAIEALSASIATLGNLGPGLGQLGPFGSFLFFPETSKLLMVVLMWLGRLEVVPVLVIFTRSFWEW
ncbi:TrkH family potassium uptake protein [Halobacterium salinarum]|uniref:Trk system potassium uptake protein TrkH n=2 Tax=Halobacterium salinarum TaxID=2242 RepID=A0A841HEL8_HALSI|nr:TrkH family potassium uptake protein [Halobacterium salinarum]MBB6090879.1 trk system potassium uptake protein TrkH [Halobacterium salinarum]MDL0137905.1 TrkH family potassium uptake protein [Halobacterium salinarum]UEB93160.1 TrkH family potassium uptake protein [Halobacterium salinarum NRC-34001]CAP15618.1 Trk-type transport system (probable substrate potassium) [Halobacterium salinarum R1]